MNRTLRFAITASFLLLLSFNQSAAQQPIKINQLGYYPEAEKIAVVPDGASGEFRIRDVEADEVVFTGELSDSRTWPYSGEDVAIADLSDFETTGTYRVEHDQTEPSFEFEISDRVHRDLAKASVRALYYNRASIELEEEYAGHWARPMGHPDEEVMVHASAATGERPEGYTFASPKGWYDAGDYNKYIVNSGISTYTLLAAYEHFPEYYEQLDLNIPESGNNQPDLLDEARWNIDWMLTMQDPHDGGVYHKLTAPNFQGVVMPHEVDSDRYAVQKSTAAALNFAAVMATTARVYEDYDSGLAGEALEAAKAAWQWAQENPEVYYDQSAMNEEYDPDIVTGAYGDGDVEDEFDWAAAELYITTGNDEYWHARDFEAAENGIPSWGYTRPLAWVSLAHHRDALTEAADRELIEQRIVGQAEELLDEYETSAYGISMGAYGGDDFVWGSNAMAGNHSLMLLQGYRLTGEEAYRDAALSNLDYLLGRNATDYSFVTGYGKKTPMDPHHRPSAADEENEEPVPGFVMGGPQPGQHEDDEDCMYPSELPAKSYIDDWCSYSTNEVTINWNAPLIYISGALEASFE